MPIVSKRLTQNALNRNKTFRHVGWVFTDQEGKEWLYGGMHLAPRTDGDHITDTLLEDLKDKLVVKSNKFLKGRDLRDAVYKDDWNYSLKENTEAGLLAYARQQYFNGREENFVPLAIRIEEWIDNSRFTVTEVRTAFGKTKEEFNQFRTRLKAIRDGNNAIRGARSE